MYDFLGFLLLQRVGCFARWLVTGGKGSFKDFYATKRMYIADAFIGIVIFFIIMYIVIVVFNADGKNNI